ADVLRILDDLGIDEKERSERIIEVWNKIDRLDPENHDGILQKAAGRENVLPVSAISGEGVDTLLDVISQRLSGVLTEATITIAADRHAVISWLYENAVVSGREDHEDGSVSLDVRLTDRQADELERKLGGKKPTEKEDWER
ncbi:MAG: GTPase HflX, partial [Alphaproteobacteria bacterium]|nr:GTPase HflX [Alphaproteobacteria bacterium]